MWPSEGGCGERICTTVFVVSTSEGGLCGQQAREDYVDGQVRRGVW